MGAFVLHQLLSETASRMPDKEAVRFRAARLTYAELDRATDVVASALRTIGVHCGDRVGILVHKSIDSIVCVFAVLKAGGVYVPLDPNSPVARSASIARDCGIGVVLVQQATLPLAQGMVEHAACLRFAIPLPADPAGFMSPPMPVRLSDAADGAQQRTMAESPLESDIAYILYTSGSTGTPKGVVISHRNALTFVDWASSTFDLSPDDTVSNHTPLHFDLSVFDIFAAVQRGATIVPVPEGLAVFPAALSSWMQENAITVWYSVPSVLTTLVTGGALANRHLESLRTVLFAGEVFPVTFLRRLMDLLPGARYFNLYGPTETNVITSYEVLPIAVDSQGAIPIGTACANMAAFALDTAGQLVESPGVEGELYGRGPSVALGYWNRPDLTAELFRQNPLHNQYLDRTYRTGDIVVLDENRQYVYRGRRDHMVKTRGHRVELAEIEMTLFGCGVLKEAAVVAVADQQLGNRLHAYVAVSQPEVEVSTIVAYCRDRLPSYMVPETIDVLPSLPKTSNGKVDRTVLQQRSGVLRPASFGR
jgi:amino acid adenylation domain-containing protein